MEMWYKVCVCVVYLCRADGLTQLAGNAAFFSARVTSQGVLATETRRQGTFLKRIVDGGRLTEQVAHGHSQTWRSVRKLVCACTLVCVCVCVFYL